ncbi:M20/M25/M40 family metallo-hydrolase [Aureliella helgolandensis]|nr:M20/M25/M40 family metallo-hydrolase [Aureliella helgolandensis]
MRTVLKRILGLLIVALLLLIGIGSWNLSQFQSRQLQLSPVAVLALDESTVEEHLSAAIQIPTVSLSMAKLTADSSLHQLRSYLETTFPHLHQLPFIRRTGIDFGDELNPSVLLEWPGRQPQLEPILLMSHMDVVPAERSSLDQWTHPPFSGKSDGEFIWGRGTIDCKHGVMGILEAVSQLVDEGFQPDRTVFIALGHDEELGGASGNKKIAEWMRSQGHKLHLILDEGGCIFTEFPGLQGRPAALVGIAEKGYLNVELKVDLASEQVGHSSMPPAETAISILSSAVHKAQTHPLPARTEVAMRETLQYIGPEMPSALSRFAMANMWLFQPLIERTLSAKPSGNAMLRSTIASTMITGGTLPNVLPNQAVATLNIRLMPGDSNEAILQHLTTTIGDDRVAIDMVPPGSEASAISSTQSAPFQQLHRTIREISNDVVVAPFVLVGATDTVHYADLCNHIYRFIPTRLSEADTRRFHGVNERIAKANYFEIIRFYHQFIKNTTQ